MNKKSGFVLEQKREKKEFAEILMKSGVMDFDFKHSYTFVSGVTSPIYADNRLLIGYIDYRTRIVDSFMEIIKKEKIKVDAVGGIATGGIPWAAWIADRLNLPLVCLMTEKQLRRNEKIIEGHLEPKSNVLLVEDALCSGSSSLKAAKVLRERGHIVEHCLSIFDYDVSSLDENFHRGRIKKHVLVHAKETIDLALKQKIISEKDLAKIDEWQKQPRVCHI